MHVILLSGKAGHGKDTAAGMISDALERAGARVLITHYADLLKYICRTFFNWNGEKDEHGRHVLQYVGTDVIRRQDPDFWVRFLIVMLTWFGENWDYVIVPDARFPNEVTRLREDGFRVTYIRVIRPWFSGSLTDEQKKHPSETALDDIQPDAVIVNDGGLESLRAAVEILVKERLYESKT